MNKKGILGILFEQRELLVKFAIKYLDADDNDRFIATNEMIAKMDVLINILLADKPLEICNSSDIIDFVDNQMHYQLKPKYDRDNILKTKKGRNNGPTAANHSQK